MTSDDAPPPQNEGWLVRLDDYVEGALSGQETDAFEDELFARAAGARPDEDTAFFDALARNAAWLARHVFGFRGGSTRQEVEALMASGHRRVHLMDLGAPGPKQLSGWPEGTQIVVTRVGVDLRGTTDVQVHVSFDGQTPIKTFRDCEYDPTDGALYAVCHEPLARLAFGQP
ncbi:MAG TPA: hypothetical protein VN962_15575, partial [Polyangia bacterium]|nr:hypothetical protein [Polyangia bacterium]